MNNTEERDWRAWAEEMERQRDSFRDEAKTLTAALTGDTWAWGDDAEDHLDSMGNGMIVAIRADALRALLRDEPVPQLGDGVHWCSTCRSVVDTVHHSIGDVWCRGEGEWIQGPFYKRNRR